MNTGGSFHQHVRELLPWAVTGQLSPREQHDVDAALAESPALQAEYRWLETLHEELRQTPGEFNEELSLEKTLQLIRAEREGMLSVLPRPVQARSWERPALALAASVVLIQAIALGLIASRPDNHAALSPLAGPRIGNGDTLHIAFRPSATHTQIAAALASVGGRIIDGPGSLGLYTVEIPKATAAKAQGLLAADPAIDTVSIADS